MPKFNVTVGVDRREYYTISVDAESHEAAEAVALPQFWEEGGIYDDSGDLVDDSAYVSNIDALESEDEDIDALESEDEDSEKPQPIPTAVPFISGEHLPSLSRYTLNNLPPEGTRFRVMRNCTTPHHDPHYSPRIGQIGTYLGHYTAMTFHLRMPDGESVSWFPSEIALADGDDADDNALFEEDHAHG